MTVERVVFWFVDGLGLGPPDPERNPLVAARTPALASVLGGPVCAAYLPAANGRGAAVPLDATLGVAGRPQSGTGQVALLTGCNAASLEGRHVPGFPTARLREVLRRYSLFRRLKSRGLSVALANAYPPTFFQPTKLPRAAFSFAACSAGVRLRDLNDLSVRQAVAADLTGEGLATRGFPVEVVEPEEAGVRLARIARAHAFTAFEFPALDLVAHGRWPGSVVEVLETLDRALGAAVAALDPDNSLLVLTSDHGNAESPEGSHTTNLVPLVVWGRKAHEVVRRCRSLVDVAPAVEQILCGPG